MGNYTDYFTKPLDDILEDYDRSSSEERERYSYSPYYMRFTNWDTRNQEDDD